jgi:uncharacterized protein YbjT (DUF2867 family)
VKLKDAGAEVAAFDMGKSDTFEEALKGLTALYVVTTLREDPTLLEALISAGEEAGVQHYIWSTLEDTTEFFDSLPEEERVPKIDGYYLPHFDTKSLADKHFPKDKTTFLYTSFYLENLYSYGMVQGGVFCCNQGDTACPVISNDDIGNCANAILKGGDEYKGKSVGIAGDCLTFAELMKIVSEETGKEYKFQNVDRATYSGFFPGADDMANMFEFYTKNAKQVSELRDLDKTKQLYPDVVDARAWVKAHVKELLAVGPKDS